MNMTCKNCMHADETKDGYVCRRFPPKPILVPHKNVMTQEAGMAIQSFWPAVGATDTCGEFEPGQGGEAA